MLTEFQTRKMTKLFSLYDYDGNGYLEKKDYLALGERIAADSNIKSGTTMYDMIMKRVLTDWTETVQFADIDQDGRISIEDWLGFMNLAVENPAIYKVTVTDIAESFFESWDIDGSGKIGINEWKRAFRIFGQSEHDGEAAFVALAGNANGSLSHDDVHTALDGFFRSNEPSDLCNAMFGSL